MASIYLVVSGEYSSYGVHAAFTTRELAEAYIAFHGDDGNWYEIEERDLDPKCEPHINTPSGMTPMRVTMKRDGDAINIQRMSLGEPLRKDSLELDDGFKPCDLATFYCYATDERHAVKIANERRTKLIAEGNWPTERERYELARRTREFSPTVRKIHIPFPIGIAISGCVAAATGSAVMGAIAGRSLLGGIAGAVLGGLEAE